MLVLFLFTVAKPSMVHAQSYALSSRWSVAENAATHPFLHGGDVTRGMAYNPASGHLLVVTRTNPVAAVHILNETDGAIVGALSYDTNVIWGGNFALNQIGVADDGVIYAANFTTDAATALTAAAGPFRLYRWASEGAAAPQMVYSGDPTANTTVGNTPRRLGDTMIVRGSGVNTEILLGTFNQSVYRLTTTDGVNFTSQKITTDALDSDTRWGLAWGAGNTFWAKQANGNLKQFSMNLAAGTATTITSISGVASLAGGPIAVDTTRNLLAIIETSATTHALRVYDISVPAAPVQVDTTKNFLTTAANGNGTGATILRDGKVFALESNNGLLAYTLNEVFLPPTVATQPASVTLWDGAASWQFAAGISGTKPFTYQWRYNGQPIAGETGPTLTLSNISTNKAGSYSVAVTNAYGNTTSSAATLTVSPTVNSAQVSNIWNVLPGERPYLSTGYKEYGLAYNKLSGNLLVLTRVNPTNMLAVLDAATGAHKYYVDLSGLTVAGTGLPMNRIGVADDGAIYIANTSPNGSTSPFVINGIGSDVPQTSDKWLAFTGNPGAGSTESANAWGGTLAVRGGGMETEILVSSSTTTAKTVAIFRPNASYYFTPTVINVTNAAAGFARLGIAWGPGNNTFWGKAVSSLVLVEYDINTGTGFVKKTYPLTGNRSVADNVTGIGYDPSSGLLAGLHNGTVVRPVSVPVYDARDINAGPLLVDRELCTTYNADVEFYGKAEFGGGYLFALALNNGIKAFKVNASFISMPAIVTQPVGGTYYQGSNATISVAVDSASPVTYKWYLNDVEVPGMTSGTNVISNIQLNQAGVYTVRVSNGGGFVDSAPATVNVIEVLDTAASTNIWTLAPGSRSYLTTNYKQYGLGYNPVTTNLLITSLEGSTTVAVLDALTGTEKNFLNVSGITGGTKVLQKIDVADDGVVYAGNLTTAAATTSFKLYRWSNDDAATVPTVAFNGDPAPTYVSAFKGFGYTLDVRGAGVNTEVLLGMNGSNVVSILKTANGTDFTANEVVVTNAPFAFARLGAAFGEGNTFWAKNSAGQLYLVSYDLAAKTGAVLKSYPTTEVPGSITALAYSTSYKYLAALDNFNNVPPKNVRLYNAANTDALQLADMKLLQSGNGSIEWNGELRFGGNYLFALDQNNGVQAYRLNITPPASSFKIFAVATAGGAVTLQWEAREGASYQVQYSTSVSGGWTNLGSPVTASGNSASYVDTVPGGVTQRFYRILAN